MDSNEDIIIKFMYYNKCCIIVKDNIVIQVTNIGQEKLKENLLNKT